MESGVSFGSRYFNPRTSCEVRLLPDKSQSFRQMDFNPRTSCEVRQVKNVPKEPEKKISIHAPRVRCDLFLRFSAAAARCISIHAPRVRCDDPMMAALHRAAVFQSTHLV